MELVLAIAESSDMCIYMYIYLLRTRVLSDDYIVWKLYNRPILLAESPPPLFSKDLVNICSKRMELFLPFPWQIIHILFGESLKRLLSVEFIFAFVGISDVSSHEQY